MFGACSLPLLKPQKTGRAEEPKIDEEQRGAGARAWQKRGETFFHFLSKPLSLHGRQHISEVVAASVC